MILGRVTIKKKEAVSQATTEIAKMTTRMAILNPTAIKTTPMATRIKNPMIKTVAAQIVIPVIKTAIVIRAALAIAAKALPIIAGITAIVAQIIAAAIPQIITVIKTAIVTQIIAAVIIQTIIAITIPRIILRRLSQTSALYRLQLLLSGTLLRAL
jgi:hypothetical protein